MLNVQTIKDDYTEKIGYYLQMLKRFSYPVSQRLGQLFLSQVLHFSMCVKKSSPLHSNNGPPLSSAQSVFLYKQIRTTFVKQKTFLKHGTVSTVKSPTLCHQLHVKMAFMTKIKSYSNDLQYIN